VVSTVTPLRKRRKDTGALYERRAPVEALLADLVTLSRDELIERSSILDRSNPLYVPSECLLYFIRACRNENGEAWFERLYKMFWRRVLRSFPRPENADGETASLTRETVRARGCDRLNEMLAADRGGYLEKLDYFEISFDGAMAKLKVDAMRVAYRDEKRSGPLEADDGRDLLPEVEEAAGAYNPFDPAKINEIDFRSRLLAAIDALPEEQSRIVHMISRGFLIESEDPSIVTIAKVLGCAGRTVRNRRDKAFAAIRIATAKGAKK
jgi:hypothetical protein